MDFELEFVENNILHFMLSYCNYIQFWFLWKIILKYFFILIIISTLMTCLFSGIIREERGEQVECMFGLIFMRVLDGWGAGWDVFLLFTKMRRFVLITCRHNRHNAILLWYPCIHFEYIKHSEYIGGHLCMHSIQWCQFWTNFEWGFLLTVVRVLGSSGAEENLHHLLKKVLDLWTC